MDMIFNKNRILKDVFPPGRSLASIAFAMKRLAITIALLGYATYGGRLRREGVE